MELLALILANFSPKIEWHEKRTPGRLKFQSGMVFCFGLTVTSHHILFKNVFKVDFVLTVYNSNYEWVKKNI